MDSVLYIGDTRVATGSLPAVKSLTYKRTAVTEQDFFYGSAAPAAIEVTVIGDLPLAPGESVTYWEGDMLRGVFYCADIKRPTPHTVRFTAYDAMTWLDTDLTDWLAALPDWPYTMESLLELTAEHCGLPISFAELPNGELPVPRFLQKVTGRDLVRWVCQANACFARVDEMGALRLEHLRQRELDSAVKSAVLSEFETAPIVRVAVRKSEDDVGIVYPNVEGETYEILRNPLLAAADEQAVANIADAVVGFSHTPMTLKLWATELHAGDVFTYEGKRLVVFSEERRDALVTLRSTGSPTRTAVTAVYGKTLTSVVQGQLARVQVTLEGLETEVAQTGLTLDTVRRDSAALKQTASGLELRVESAEETAGALSGRVTALETDADSVELSILQLRGTVDGKADRESVEELTRTFRFDGEGLTISGKATGMGIKLSEEQVAFTGGTVITPSNMHTTDLQVGRSLALGAFSFIPRTNGNLSLRWTGG